MMKKNTGKSHSILWVMSWRTKPKKVRSSLYLLVDRKFARAQHLDNLEPVYCYGGYENGRPVLLVYLDKKNMIGKIEK